jgi:hypothetical protein
MDAVTRFTKSSLSSMRNYLEASLPDFAHFEILAVFMTTLRINRYQKFILRFMRWRVKISGAPPRPSPSTLPFNCVPSFAPAQAINNPLQRRSSAHPHGTGDFHYSLKTDITQFHSFITIPETSCNSCLLESPQKSLVKIEASARLATRPPLVYHSGLV